MRVLIALGGNALLPRGVAPDADVQVAHVEAVAPALARAASLHRVVITHGNGPQVGMLATESSDDPMLHRPYPLDALVAETQGMIGYWLQRELAAAGLAGPVVTLLTQTVVAADDPAFERPTKFVGPCVDEATARRLEADRGWVVARDGDAWRRVVPSPMPLDVVELPLIRSLADDRGVTVVCAGGGGIPVVVTPAGLDGVEAVVDKDHVAALMALRLEVDLLVLLTDVDAVYEAFGTPEQRPLGRVDVDRAASVAVPAGSMGPKLAAACRFARVSGRTAVIGALADLDAILEGSAGTRVSG